MQKYNFEANYQVVHCTYCALAGVHKFERQKSFVMGARISYVFSKRLGWQNCNCVKNVKKQKFVEANSGLKSVEEQKLRMATSMLKIVKTKTQVERTSPLR